MKNPRNTKPNTPNLTRRNFLKYSAIGSAALTFAPGFLSAKINEIIPAPSLAKSKVTIVKHSKVVTAGGFADNEITKEMINRGILNFTEEGSLKDAWLQFFSYEDIIGLKLNTLGLSNIEGTKFTSHYTAITNALVSSLRNGGFNESNMLVWDRSDEELESAGLTIQKEEGKLRVFGHHSDRRTPSIGYTDQSFPVGNKSSHLSKIFYDICSAHINVPIVKHHHNAGLTCALKSHYGTIDNAREFHANGCTNPGIPEVNMIPAIRSKQKLVICDALVGLFDGGPRWNAQYVFPYGAIIIGTDPVAVDTIALSILDGQRAKEDLPLVSDRIEYLKLSQDLGLGNCNINNITVNELVIG